MLANYRNGVKKYADARRTAVDYGRKMSVATAVCAGVTVGLSVKIEIDINVDIKSSLRAFALLFWMKMV